MKTIRARLFRALAGGLLAWLNASGSGVFAADLNVLQKQYNVAMAARQFPQAETLAKQALAQAERGANPRTTLTWLDNLAKVLQKQGHLAAAEPLFQRIVALEEKTSGAEHFNVAVSLNDLANLYVEQAKYALAEPIFKRSLAIRERTSGKQSVHVASVLNNLGNMYRGQSRFAEAEESYKRSLAIREKGLGPKDTQVAQSLNNLGVLYNDRGRFADAEPLFRRSLSIYQSALGPNDPLVADELNNLGIVFNLQGRFAEAETFCRRALAINEKVFGDHPRVAMNLTNLAHAKLGQNQFADAATLYRRALAINQQFLGDDHPDVARDTVNLAGLYQRIGEYDRAAALYRRSLNTLEETFGPDHFLVGQALYHQAALRNNEGEFAVAEKLINRANAILDQSGALPETRFKSYVLAAELAWRAERKEEAVEAISKAIELAEVSRAQASGADRERAETFSQSAIAYEHLVEWQRQLGNTAAAFSTAERGRARSLLDQLSAAHVDLLAGLPAQEAMALHDREAKAQSNLAALEKNWELLQAKRASVAELEQQEQAIVRARRELVDAYVAIRNASPAYRQMVAEDFQPTSVEAIQTRLAGDDKLVLEYVIGQAEGYCIVIGPTGTSPRIESLVVDKAQGRTLHVSPGPLNAEVLRESLMNAAGSGVLQMLRRNTTVPKAAEGLAALWMLLIPEKEREAILSGKIKQLIIIPDGQLAILPFESLVVETGEEPRYLLDVNVPVIYAPSATLLSNIQEQVSRSKPSPVKGALSVGDAIYDRALPVSGSTPRNQLTALPSTGIESTWVVDAFQKAGMKTQQLKKADATEAQVRANIIDRQILHFACHGILDQTFGNLFGALAFTVGPSGASTSQDDGLLTLGEIYELDLRNCELAILSACNTNDGPQQQGEGSWALSHGFMVAGAQRVVASNWLVDDDAAATLIGDFCRRVADSSRQGPIDYARSLHDAKLLVREQERWKSPYYWALFELLGPN